MNKDEKQPRAHALYSRHQLASSSLTVEAGHMEELRRLWATGALTKYQFAEAMHVYHQLLFQYARLMKDNVMVGLYLSAEGVRAQSRDGVLFACNSEDVYSTPFGALSFGEAEPVVGAWLKRLMPEQGVFFDIGANVGWFSLHIAQGLPQARIFSFEPLPDTFGRLQDNIALNQAENINALNVGLGEKEETLTFYFRPEMTGAASARNITETEQARLLSCPVRRLDDCWREIGCNPDLIKCDVEGGELFVFRGGSECLQTARPAILCEMLRKWSAKFEYHPNDILSFLGGLGYVCFEPLPDTLKPFTHMTEETLATNFVFLHSDRHAEIIRQYSMAEER